MYQMEESCLPMRAEGHGEALASGKHVEWEQGWGGRA